MKPFRHLTRRGQILRMRRAAERALFAWGLSGARLTFLDLVENATFRVDDGERRLLRIQLPVYKDPVAIRFEFEWLRALRRDTNLDVPTAVPSLSGETVVAVETESDPPRVHASLLTWIPGRIHARAGPRHLHAIGALMARLQEHAGAWERPAGFRRYDWRGRGLFGVGNDYARDPAETWSLVPERHRELFRAVEARTLRVMAELDRRPDSAGLVHADLHPANVVFRRGEACPIDFEDCGIGYRIYDLAVPAAFCLGRPEHPELVAALVSGYESVRPFPGGGLPHLDLFQAAREVSNGLWLADHSFELAQFREGLPRWLDVLASRVRSLDVV